MAFDCDEKHDGQSARTVTQIEEQIVERNEERPVFDLLSVATGCQARDFGG
jgi:hypothetical protein